MNEAITFYNRKNVYLTSVFEIGSRTICGTSTYMAPEVIRWQFY
jgi:serine/threonine protein kinase